MNLTNLVEAKPVRVEEMGFHRVTACVTTPLNQTFFSNVNVWGSLDRDPYAIPIVKFIDGNCQRPKLVLHWPLPMCNVK